MSILTKLSKTRDKTGLTCSPWGNEEAVTKKALADHVAFDIV